MWAATSGITRSRHEGSPEQIRARTSHGEEPAGHLLAGADLREVPVDRVIEIDGKGPLGGRIDGLVGERRDVHGRLPAEHPGGDFGMDGDDHTARQIGRAHV